MARITAAEVAVILNGNASQLQQTLRTSEQGVMGWVRRVTGLRPAVNLSTAAAERNLNAFAERARAKLSGGFSVAGGALAQFGGNLLTSAFGKITGGMSDLIDRGILYNDVLEKGTIAFRKFLGGPKNAQKMLDDLALFAQQTPFEFKGLVETSAVMASMGYAAEDIIPTLRNLGDAVSAVGGGKDTLDNVLRQLSQMRMKGNLASSEMQILAENGLPAWELLAKSIGMTVEETRKLTESGKLRGDVAAKIITQAAGQRFGGMMNEMSATRAGMESNLNDAKDQAAGRAVAAGYFEEIKNGYRQQVAFINGEGGALMVEASGKAGELAGIAYNEAQRKAMMQFNLFAKDANEGGAAAAAGNAIINNTPKPVIDAANRVIGVMGTVEGAANKILNWRIPGFAGGGKVSGPGTSTSDSIAATLSNDEFVVQASAARRVGYPFLDAINNGNLFHFKKGGRVRENASANRARNEALLRDPRVRALLDAIALGEASDYDVIVGGSRFSDFSQHPNKYVPKFNSTAAGRYQFNRATWQETAPKVGLTDFSPRSQDLAAIQLMVQEGMIESLFQGNLPQAIMRGNNRWASLAGAPYGQKTLPLSSTIAAYNRSLANGPVAGGGAPGGTPGRPLYVAQAPGRFASGYDTAEKDKNHRDVMNYINNVTADDLINRAKRRRAESLPRYATDPNRDPFTSNIPNSTKMEAALKTIAQLKDVIQKLNEIENTRALTDTEAADRKQAQELVAAWKAVFPSTFRVAAESFSTSAKELADVTIPLLTDEAARLGTVADLHFKKLIPLPDPTKGSATASGGALTPEQIAANRAALIKPGESDQINWNEVVKEESRNAFRQLLTGNFRGALSSFFSGIGNKMLDGMADQLTGKWMDAIGKRLAGFLSNIMGKLFGGLFSGAGGRAEGGPVSAGKMYRIRERGADEYFVPEVDGQIYNQQQMNAAMGGRRGSRERSGPANVTFVLPPDSREPISRKSMRQAAREFQLQTQTSQK